MTNVNSEVGKEVVNRVVGLPGVLKDLVVTPDAGVMALLKLNGELRIGVRDHVAKKTLQLTLPFEVAKVSLRPDGSEFAVLPAGGNSIARYRIADSQAPRKIVFANPTAIAYNDDGKLLAAGSTNGRLMVWYLQDDGHPRAILESQVTNEPIARLGFGFHCLVAITASGKCYRVPFHFIGMPQILITEKAQHRLIAGDGNHMNGIVIHTLTTRHFHWKRLVASAEC